METFYTFILLSEFSFIFNISDPSVNVLDSLNNFNTSYLCNGELISFHAILTSEITSFIQMRVLRAFRLFRLLGKMGDLKKIVTAVAISIVPTLQALVKGTRHHAIKNL